MKLRFANSQQPAAWFRRALSPAHRTVTSSAAVLLALGVISSSPVSAEVIAGWDTWVDSGSDNYNATDLNGATGLAVGTATGGSGWNNWNSAANQHGGSADGTWGTSTEPGADTSVADTTAAVGLVNATTSGEMTFTVTNTSGLDKNLTGFHFDGGETRTKAAGDWTLSILAGSDVTAVENLASGTLPVNLAAPLGDFDIDLTGLADRKLENGGTVIFRLAFTGGGGDGAGGHNAMIDNVAVTGDFATNNKLVITSVPASVTAGTNFSVTVQAQNGSGSPLNVGTATSVTLNSSGTGSLTGNTATIPAGANSVTLSSVQATVAEAITLSAARSSGDVIASSAPSSAITVNPGPASQLVVETAANGSGVAVPAQTVYPGSSITAYANTRDVYGNFVANAPATWSLANTTGNIVAGNLVSNTDGSATFTANGVGTTNLRAAFSGFQADSGLISVEPFIHQWTGAGANGSWETAANWAGNVLPAFDNTTDLYFSAPGNSKGSPYIGNDKTVRSITYETTTTTNLSISFVKAGNALPANLTFDTDSTTGPAKINVNAAFTGVATLGYTSTTAAGRGIMILADNLLVTHNGTGNLVLNGDITQSGGTYGITKTGSGTLVISGTNTYTGATIVTGGVLAVKGSSISDSGKLTVNGGVVDVSGTEVVAALDFGSGPVAAGTYGATGSGAATIDDVHFTGSGVISVVPSSGYSTWAGANVGGQSPSGDFNSDGVANGIAYFMNNPGRIILPRLTAGSITWPNGGNIPASDYGTKYLVETSQNLVTWTPVAVADLTANTSGPGGSLTYTPPTGKGKWFVRLKVMPN